MISEQICYEFYKLYNIQTISLRVFSAFGPRLKKQLFWDLHTKLSNGDSTSLFGTGKESRDFIFIADLCQAVDCVINRSSFNGKAINIASGNETTISDAVKTFAQEYNSNENLMFNGYVKEGDPVNWKADITELIELGFKPKYSFELGIKELIKWLKNA
jgi:dTDP-glucose 4,6-dehydratase/UDP-glucose 4-epimerase